jgi:hypothetical protein
MLGLVDLAGVLRRPLRHRAPDERVVERAGVETVALPHGGDVRRDVAVRGVRRRGFEVATDFELHRLSGLGRVALRGVDARLERVGLLLGALRLTLGRLR